jgi:hypothetical protein
MFERITRSRIPHFKLNSINLTKKKINILFIIKLEGILNFKLYNKVLVIASMN